MSTASPNPVSAPTNAAPATSTAALHEELPEGMTGAARFVPTDAAAYGAPRNAVSLARRAAKAGWAAILECEGLDRPTEARVWRVIASALLRADDGRDVFGLSTITAEWHGGKYASGTRTHSGKQIGSSLLLAAVRDAFTVDGVAVVEREAERSGATYRGRDRDYWIAVGEQQVERAWAATWRADEVKDECAAARHRRGITTAPLVQPELDAMMQGAWEADAVDARRSCVPLWVDLAEHAVYAHCRTADRIARRAEGAIRRIQVLAWEAEGHQARDEPAPTWAPTAQDAWEHARRSRLLADRAQETANAARAARMAAEAETECAPAVAIEYERLREWDAQRAAERPDDTADTYARARGMFEDYRRSWVAWERGNRRPSETLGEAYDRRAHITKGGWSSAEFKTGDVNRHTRNRAIFALGIAAAQCAQFAKGWDAAQCTKVRQAAEHGQSLYAQGARPGKDERDAAAARVWRMLVPRAERWGSGFDVLRTDRDIARLDAAGWAGTGACDEADDLRRALLIEHALNVRTLLMTDMKRERDARDDQRSSKVADAHIAAKTKAVEGGADEETALAAGHRAGAPVRAAMNAVYQAGEAAWVATLEEGERVTGGHMVLLGTYWLERAHAARLAAEDTARGASTAAPRREAAPLHR